MIDKIRKLIAQQLWFPRWQYVLLAVLFVLPSAWLLNAVSTDPKAAVRMSDQLKDDLAQLDITSLISTYRNHLWDQARPCAKQCLLKMNCEYRNELRNRLRDITPLPLPQSEWTPLPLPLPQPELSPAQLLAKEPNETCPLDCPIVCSPDVDYTRLPHALPWATITTVAALWRDLHWTGFLIVAVAAVLSAGGFTALHRSSTGNYPNPWLVYFVSLPLIVVFALAFKWIFFGLLGAFGAIVGQLIAFASVVAALGIAWKVLSTARRFQAFLEKPGTSGEPDKQ